MSAILVCKDGSPLPSTPLEVPARYKWRGLAAEKVDKKSIMGHPCWSNYHESDLHACKLESESFAAVSRRRIWWPLHQLPDEDRWL